MALLPFADMPKKRYFINKLTMHVYFPKTVKNANFIFYFVPNINRKFRIYDGNIEYHLFAVLLSFASCLLRY